MGTIDSWLSIEATIKQRLELNEISRRFCAVCGRQSSTLSRCFACQMVYYCGEEHQIQDWSNEHAQKCAQLEWVALGEFIQALPAQPPLPNIGDKWPLSLKDIHNWKHWFSIRANIVNLANNTANVLKNLEHLNDKRQPTHQNAVDGLLAAVTDLLTHVLTIGKAVVCFGLQPHVRPIVIHILSGFNKIDLVGNNQSSANLPARFHELLNMFPDNKGVELVIVIGDDDQDDTDYSSIPNAKLKSDRLIITTVGKGRRFDIVEEKRQPRSVPDLVVYFNAAYLFSSSNQGLLTEMLIKRRPTLLTFEDQEDFHQAQRYLSAKCINIKQAGSNQFSSLIIRQRSKKPNSTYSTNSYQILLNATAITGVTERKDEYCSILSHQRPHQLSNGTQHDHFQQQQQQQQQQYQFNPSLKQATSKMHIESLSSSLSHNTQANNNGTLLDTNAHIVSTANNTTPTTTVQPLVRSNNNIRQPSSSTVQRQHPSPPTLPPSSSANNDTAAYQKIDSSTTAEMLTATEIINNTHSRPQPKPRLSLVKTLDKNTHVTKLQVSDNLVQRMRPIFEQTTSAIPSSESKIIKQQRQPISIPYTYEKGNTTKVTCLDDYISPNNTYSTSQSARPSSSVDTHTNEQTITTAAITSLQSPVEIPYKECPVMTNTINNSQNPQPIIDRRNDERIVKVNTNSVSSSFSMSHEICRDQRTTITHHKSVSSSSPSTSSSSSSSSIEKRSNEHITTAAATISVPSIQSQPIETHIDHSNVLPNKISDSSLPVQSTPSQKSSSPMSPQNEIIYTEVIKNPNRSLSAHHNDLLKSPISPSRSFIIPTKSPSISSKNSSFNIQRPSRSQTTSNFLSYTNNKTKPIQSTMTSDRISLYSQRSNKQLDDGVTMKNLSGCIDRVAIVFDDTNRRQDTPLAGLTTVDLIREQLNTSSTPNSCGSLLDKLYNSNSNTRFSTSFRLATPRSKSQQATRTYDDQPKPTPSKKTIAAPPPPPSSSSASSTTTTSAAAAVANTPSQPTRRSAGVFLPVTSKASNEPESSSALLYQNLDPHNLNLPSQPVDYTLKQPSAPVCMGIPKPFRKPTAIIEPSPIVTKPEPNYINLTHFDEHIYSNENNEQTTTMNGSNSNSYTSKTSSIYSTSDKQNLESNAAAHYAMTNISSTQQEQSIEYDSFDDEMVGDDMAKIEKPLHSNDNTDNDSFDDDDNNNHNVNTINSHETLSNQSTPLKTSSKNFFRTTLNRLTRSNKSLDRLNSETVINDNNIQETNPINAIDTKTKKTLRSIKARHEAKRTGNLLTTYNGDDDTTSIDSNCSVQTSTSLNKSVKSSSNRFRLFRRKIEKEFASDTEAEKHQTEQRRKKWSKDTLISHADELKAKRLLMMSDDDDDNDHHEEIKENLIADEAHIYDHIVHDDNHTMNAISNNNSSRMGKLSNEMRTKSPTVTLDEIRSEIKAEIAARQDVNAPPTISSNLNSQKKRSKSVTFLDELLTDDSKQRQQQQQQQQHDFNMAYRHDTPTKPSTTVKRIEKGDARSICGALTGTGPIRGIIKAANNDITGTTAPISPSAAAAIYLSGPSVDVRCTSPKITERTHRPLSTYTVGSACFYDGASTVSSTMSSPSTTSTNYSLNQTHNNTVQNNRPILNNSSPSATSNNIHYKRPTAKVSPFQAKSPNDTTSPLSANKQAVPKKVIRPAVQRNLQMSYDITNVATSSVGDVVGGVSKRLQSNF